MTVREALALFPDRSDGEIAVGHIVKRPRTWVFAHPEHPLSDTEAELLRFFAERRAKGEPMAYLTGEREFMGRNFRCDNRALIPRPATEELCRIALDWWRNPDDRCVAIDEGICAVGFSLSERRPITTIVDIGTGTGCIAITLALQEPGASVIGTDLSEDALTLAKENAERLKASVSFRYGATLAPLQNLEDPFVIVSNPPYIPSEMPLERNVQDFEPHMALFSGQQGMDVLGALASQARQNPACAGLLVECRADQVQALAEMLR